MMFRVDGSSGFVFRGKQFRGREFKGPKESKGGFQAFKEEKTYKCVNNS